MVYLPLRLSTSAPPAPPSPTPLTQFTTGTSISTQTSATSIDLHITRTLSSTHDEPAEDPQLGGALGAGSEKHSDRAVEEQVQAQMDSEGRVGDVGACAELDKAPTEAEGSGDLVLDSQTSDPDEDYDRAWIYSFVLTGPLSHPKAANIMGLASCPLSSLKLFSTDLVPSFHPFLKQIEEPEDVEFFGLHTATTRVLAWTTLSSTSNACTLALGGSIFGPSLFKRVHRSPLTLVCLSFGLDSPVTNAQLTDLLKNPLRLPTSKASSSTSSIAPAERASLRTPTTSSVGGRTTECTTTGYSPVGPMDLLAPTCSPWWKLARESGSRSQARYWKQSRLRTSFSTRWSGRGA